jgi:hypothetical protein
LNYMNNIMAAEVYAWGASIWADGNYSADISANYLSTQDDIQTMLNKYAYQTHHS